MSAPVPQEVLQDVNELRWVALGKGIELRVLFTSGETGRWTAPIVFLLLFGLSPLVVPVRSGTP